jgi:hypothetical protein
MLLLTLKRHLEREMRQGGVTGEREKREKRERKKIKQ